MTITCLHAEWPTIVVAALSCAMSIGMIFFPSRLQAARRKLLTDPSEPLWLRLLARGALPFPAPLSTEARYLWLLRLGGIIMLAIFGVSVVGVYCWLRGPG